MNQFEKCHMFIWIKCKSRTFHEAIVPLEFSERPYQATKNFVGNEQEIYVLRYIEFS